jgi:hypothetical protein
MQRELVRNARIFVETSEIQTETNTSTLLSESESTSHEEVDHDNQRIAKFVLCWFSCFHNSI